MELILLIDKKGKVTFSETRLYFFLLSAAMQSSHREFPNITAPVQGLSCATVYDLGIIDTPTEACGKYPFHQPFNVTVKLY